MYLLVKESRLALIIILMVGPQSQIPHLGKCGAKYTLNRDVVRGSK